MWVSVRHIALALIAVSGPLSVPAAAQAMSLTRMQTLPGTGLLGMRVDALLHRCGLPAAIVDDLGPGRPVRWDGVPMRLSDGDWDLTYAARNHAPRKKVAWINSAPNTHVCLFSLGALDLHAQGHSGVLSVKKRADQHGYVTTYRVPEDPYAAHKVVGITGRWRTAMTLSGLRKRYGDPDEVLDDGSVRVFRYWVIKKNNRQMPISLNAVDFEIGADGKTSKSYSVHTSKVRFVQDKLDALMWQWEKNYVLD